MCNSTENIEIAHMEKIGPQKVLIVVLIQTKNMEVT